MFDRLAWSNMVNVLSSLENNGYSAIVDIVHKCQLDWLIKLTSSG
jgi:hypothetical protein